MSKKNILAIDDEPDVLDFLQLVLERSGWMLFGSDEPDKAEVIWTEAARLRREGD